MILATGQATNNREETALNIFDKCFYLHQHIESDLAEIERLKQLAQQIPTTDPAKEFVGGGFSSGSRFSKIIEKAIDMEADLMQAIEEKLDFEREIYRLMDGLDPLSALVLRKRYIKGMSVKDIALELDLSERRVHDIKSRAIKKCEESHTTSPNSAV